MNAYRILIHDARAPEPMVLQAEMARDARACAFAEARLAENAAYLAIEVWRGDKRLCRLAKPPAKAAA